MTSSTSFHWHQNCKYVSVLLFGIAVLSLFIYLNHVHPYHFVDELFHIPQTLNYCDGNYTQWDPKITTLPGLYFITTLILSPLNLCTTVWMRSINLLGTFLNLCLTYNLVKQMSNDDSSYTKNEWMSLIMAYNMTLLPPLFFFHFLYYTDLMSVNMVLLMLLLHLRGHFKTSALIGFLSILVRQTNIIWVAFVGFERLLDVLEQTINKPCSTKVLRTPQHMKLLWDYVKQEIQRGPTLFTKFVIQLCIKLSPYIIIGVVFVAFLMWNGGIVVGDRNAHIPVIHIPQIFYFTAFSFCFSWPYMIIYWKRFLHSVWDYWVMTSCILVCMTVIVHNNTLVHPYLLADNRHYNFYFWNKFMGRYAAFKYLLIPVYCFTMYTMLHSIAHLRFMSLVSYVGSVCIVLIPQLLLEPRYFFIPYLLYRLNIQKPAKWQVIMESLTMLLVNFLQFFTFVNRIFYWEDIPHPQRIGW